MHDQNSLVAKTKKDIRGYNLLNELNTQPRTTYLAGLKNQNKDMPDYKPNVQHGEGSEEEPHPGQPKNGSESKTGGEAH